MRRVDPGRRRLERVDGRLLTTSAKAFDALQYFLEHPARPIARRTLLETLWPDTVVEENNLSQAISGLRRVLGDGYILTVPGRYRMRCGMALELAFKTTFVVGREQVDATHDLVRLGGQSRCVGVAGTAHRVPCVGRQVPRATLLKSLPLDRPRFVGGLLAQLEQGADEIRLAVGARLVEDALEVRPHRRERHTQAVRHPL